jgi:hypothetical protein
MRSYNKDVSMFRSEREAKQFYASLLGSPRILAAALTIGLFVGGFVALVSYGFFDDGRPFFTFLITTLSVAALVWLRLFAWVLRKLDLIPDRMVDTEPMRLIVETPNGRNLKLYEFKNANPREFEKIKKIVRRRGNLSQRSLDSIIGNRTNPFIDELLDRGLVEWKDPNEHRSGMIITDDGWVVFANEPHSPTSEANHA